MVSALVLQCTSLTLDVHVIINWHLSKQGICWPVSRDHIAGSSLQLNEVMCFFEVDRWPFARFSIWSRAHVRLQNKEGTLNHQQLSTTTPVSLHFNQAGHSINDVCLIPIELIRSKRDSVRKAREAHLINKAKTLHPFGVNKRDEAR